MSLSTELKTSTPSKNVPSSPHVPPAPPNSPIVIIHSEPDCEVLRSQPSDADPNDGVVIARPSPMLLLMPLSIPMLVQ